MGDFLKKSFFCFVLLLFYFNCFALHISFDCSSFYVVSVAVSEEIMIETRRKISILKEENEEIYRSLFLACSGGWIEQADKEVLFKYGLVTEYGEFIRSSLSFFKEKRSLIIENLKKLHQEHLGAFVNLFWSCYQAFPIDLEYIDILKEFGVIKKEASLYVCPIEVWIVIQKNIIFESNGYYNFIEDPSPTIFLNRKVLKKVDYYNFLDFLNS